MAAERKTDQLGRVPARGEDQYVEYIADMILELQGLAQRSGHFELAVQLLSAYEAARKVGEGEPTASTGRNAGGAAKSDCA